jgi:hypothetical protein
MKKTIITIITLGALANAGTVFKNYSLGASSFHTKVENQVMAKCSHVENNLKAWKQCKKRVIKQIIKDSKKGK